ncbi:uncharacterized protein LOC131311517 [Rhododendron vialii]|uniref:uncharacterized protein LOC131311517 n=1 Tax=Rhododendron vialii TaxID=182163 RepID=UPI00265D8815|nr:uncharacterized protein LOC131311517 [Rhododendron vialii]
MGDPYEKVKGGRLTFKGGAIASLSKSIDKKKKKKKNKKSNKDEDTHEALEEEYQPEEDEDASAAAGGGEGSVGGGGAEVYTIDAAKRMKYDQLFPVEAKKFAYDPKSNVRSVEDALDDRVKKKADRYCK